MSARANVMSLQGPENTEFKIEIDNEIIRLNRDRISSPRESIINSRDIEYEFLSDNIVYLQLCSIDKDTISKLLPFIEKANGIICDMRGYPASDHGFIFHFLSENDTSKVWIKTPKIIYPDQERLIGYEESG